MPISDFCHYTSQRIKEFVPIVEFHLSGFHIIIKSSVDITSNICLADVNNNTNIISKAGQSRANIDEKYSFTHTSIYTLRDRIAFK